MGQHKFNPTAIAAKEGKIAPKARPESLKNSVNLHRRLINHFLAKRGLAPHQLFNPQIETQEEVQNDD